LAQEAINAASEQRLLRGFIRSTGLSIQFDLPKRNSHS
jgi:hypothetical protein